MLLISRKAIMVTKCALSEPGVIIHDRANSRIGQAWPSNVLYVIDYQQPDTGKISNSNLTCQILVFVTVCLGMTCESTWDFFDTT